MNYWSYYYIYCVFHNDENLYNIMVIIFYKQFSNELFIKHNVNNHIILV